MNLLGGLDLQKPLWCLRKSYSPVTPLILVHDGSGHAACYRHISNINRDLYGINSPDFSSSHVSSSIIELAAVYAAYIQEKIDGPVLVGGEPMYQIMIYFLVS